MAACTDSEFDAIGATVLASLPRGALLWLVKAKHPMKVKPSGGSGGGAGQGKKKEAVAAGRNLPWVCSARLLVRE